MVAVTAADLQTAEALLIAEYKAKDIKLPDHVVKEDSMDQPCRRCTAVAKRAIVMMLDDSTSKPN